MAKDLAKISKDELQEWLDSFDNILFDYDGVIWSANSVIPGVMESLEVLKKIGKTSKIVTNNNLYTPEYWKKSILRKHFVEDDIISPIKVIVNFLKKEKFNKKVFVLGMQALKEALINAGIELFKFEFKSEIETVEEIKNACKYLLDDLAVGAVIIDIDFNITYMKLFKAAIILKRPDVYFISCATEKIYKTSFKANTETNVIGPHYFVQSLEASSERKATVFGKPGHQLKNYIYEEFKYIPERTLFVGDSLETDIPFANLCGYQKLLVLTGQAKLENLTSCSKEIRPQYYVNSLGDLHEMLCGLYTL